MKKVTIRIISALFAVLLLCGALPVCAQAASPEEIANEILQTEMQKNGCADAQAFVDSLAQTVGDGKEWYVFALAAREGSLDYSAYADALCRYLSEKATANAVTRQKYTMVLLACGYTSDFTEQTRNGSLGKLGLMSYVFGLHLTNNGYAPDGVSADEILDSLLALRRADGGFSVKGESAHVDDTAMALQAMAPYYGVRADVTLAIDEALALLSARQMDDGGFLSYGTKNSESISQVITTLCALGIDPMNDTRFIKNGNTLMDALLRFRTDGGFSHTIGENPNANATMQAFLAMTALQKTGSLYLMTNTAPRIFWEAEVTTDTTDKDISYKLPVIVGIATLALILCLVLFLCKRRSGKSFLAAGIAALLAVLFVLFTDFQSAESYYGKAPEKQNAIGSVTLSIRCDVLLDITDSEYVPRDGMILAPTVFMIEEGDTVYDILAEATRQYRIHMETSGAADLTYVEGIAYLYESQYGELSGWIYSVNGVQASVGCASLPLSDGDTIIWEYTLELR